MTKKLRKTIIVSSIIGGLGATALIMYKKIKNALNIQLKKTKIELIKKEGNFREYKIFIKINNPSSMLLKLRNQEYDVYFNNVYITRLKNDNEQIIYPNSISELTFDLKFDIKEILSKLNAATGKTILDKLSVLTSLKKQLIRIDIKLSVKYGILPVIPVNYTIEDKIENLQK